MTKAWFRAYVNARHNAKVQRLPAPLFRYWFNILCFAGELDDAGRLPDVDELAYDLRVSRTKAERIVTDLVAAGLLDQTRKGLRAHNWNKRQYVSDNVTQRVQKHRKGVTGNVPETLHGTPPEQNRTETDPEQSRSGSVSSEIESPPPPASGAAVQRFYKATKANEQVAALVDYARQNGVKLDGGRAAAWVRDHQKTAVMTALADGIARNAAGLEDYVTKELSNAKSGRDTSRWAKPEGARNPEGGSRIYTAEEYEEAQREVQASGAGDGPKAQPGS